MGSSGPKIESRCPDESGESRPTPGFPNSCLSFPVQLPSETPPERPQADLGLAAHPNGKNFSQGLEVTVGCGEPARRSPTKISR